MLEVFYHLPLLVGLGFHLLVGRRKMLSFLFVCLFAFMLLSITVCAHDFTVKALEYRNDFDTVSNTTKCRSLKAAKFGVFAAIG